MSVSLSASASPSFMVVGAGTSVSAASGVTTALDKITTPVIDRVQAVTIKSPIIFDFDELEEGEGISNTNSL